MIVPLPKTAASLVCKAILSFVSAFRSLLQ